MKRIYALLLLSLTFFSVTSIASAQVVRLTEPTKPPQPENPLLSFFNDRFNWENKYVSPSQIYGGSKPEVACGNSKFGVVFDDERDGNWEVYFSLLKSNGKKIGEDLRITNDSGKSANPTISWNGKDFGIFWYDNPVDSNRGIYFASVSSRGKLKIGPLRINDVSADGVHPSAVWNEKTKEYGVVWWDSRVGGTYFARVDRKGNVIAETPISTLGPSGYYRPRIGTSGDEYAIVWEEWVPCTSGSCPETAFAKVDAEGNKIGTDQVITSYGATRPKTIVWDGEEYGVLVGMGHYARLLKLASDGTILQPPIPLDLIMMANAGMVWTGKAYGVTWIDGRWATPEHPDNSEVAFQTIDKNGNAVGEVVRVSTSTGKPWNSSTPIWTGRNFAVTWVENLYEPNQSIYFAQGR